MASSSQSIYMTPPRSQESIKKMFKPKKSKGKKPAKVKLDKAKYRILKKRAVKYNKGNKVINIKNDTEFFNRITRKQKLTRRQRRIVRRRFKEGYSPFEIINNDGVQLSKTTNANKYKYLWRLMFRLDILNKMFKNYPVVGNTPGQALADGAAYVKSETQSVYISELIYNAEILNPTNYDMTVNIYDIVYKEDSRKVVGHTYYEDSSTNDLPTDGQDPISLIKLGTEGYSESTYNTIADTTQPSFDDIGYNPTQSYPFNIFCRIVKKQTFRLQPGATMSHRFKYKPNALVNLGYLYKYEDQIKNNVYIALKNMTAGVLYRINGQVSSTGSDSDRGEVALLSPKIAIKENYKIKYYCMDQKYKYIFSNDYSWTPTDESKMEVINNENIKPAQEINVNPSDNVNV